MKRELEEILKKYTADMRALYGGVFAKLFSMALMRGAITGRIPTLIS